MKDPSEYILYNRVKFDGGTRICQLRIYEANEPVPASFYVCYKSKNEAPSYSCNNIVTIDRIINDEI